MIGSGEVYGLLTTIKVARKTKHRKNVWLCRCECGGTSEVRADKLKSGATMTCGCLMEANRDNFYSTASGVNRCIKVKVLGGKKTLLQPTVTRDQLAQERASKARGVELNRKRPTRSGWWDPTKVG